MSIYYTGASFAPGTENPYDNNRPYNDNWVMVKLLEKADFKHSTGGGNDGIFRLIITKKHIDWEYRICDFIQYHSSHNKNIIVAVNEIDLNTAQSVYGNQSYTDNFLKSHEHKILIHSTSKESYESIMQSGYLYSWNVLQELGILTEDTPIGQLLGDPLDYSDYIMFTSGGLGAERVVSARQQGKLDFNYDVPYIAGARFYLDANKIADDGLLVRDGIHLKVKDSLFIDKYIIWTVTPDILGIPEETTPRMFHEKANAMFEQKFGITL